MRASRSPFLSRAALRALSAVHAAPVARSATLIIARACHGPTDARHETLAAMAARRNCARPPLRQYRPSAWEAEWRGTLARRVQHDDPRNWTLGCALMASEKAAIKAWLDFARLRRPLYRMGKSPPAPADEAKKVLSFHVTTDACTGLALSLEPIEPLVGFLRHPEAHCPQFPGSKSWVAKVVSKDCTVRSNSPFLPISSHSYTTRTLGPLGTTFVWWETARTNTILQLADQP